jgi:hypothetical protein
VTTNLAVPGSDDLTTRQLLDVLGEPDRKRLADCEIMIKRGLEAFVEVGLALTEIRDRRLYRGAYQTFEAYCRDRWSMSARTANRQVKAAWLAAVITIVGEGAGPIGPVPERESQLRPLAKLGDRPEAIRAAWDDAVQAAGGKTPTAAQVSKAVAGHRPVPQPQPQPATDYLTCPACQGSGVIPFTLARHPDLADTSHAAQRGDRKARHLLAEIAARHAADEAAP